MSKTDISSTAAPLNLAIEYRDPQSPSSFRPYANNAKKRSRKVVAQIARSIVAHGFCNPILVDESANIIAGHGRLEAALLIGLERVPVIVLSHLSETEKRAYRICDNRLTELGTWGPAELQIEFAAIALDVSYDTELTGFDLREIEMIMDGQLAEKDLDAEAISAPEEVAVSRLGDVWQIGDHKLLCGDATKIESYQALLGDERPAMVIADAPYNVPITGHVSGLGKHKHREFVQGSGELTDAQFQQFLLAFMLLCARFARRGALHYLFMDWRGLRPLLLAGAAAYDEQINLCVWAKANAGMGSLYRSQHELIAIFKKGKVPHENRVELGKNGRNRTNVWQYAGMNSPSAERTEALALHSTPKPLALIRDAILDVTSRGDIVLDPFGGSGTTLLAADKVGRIARLIELDPLYCDVIVRRAAKTLQVSPTLLATGETFDVVAARRRREAGNE